MNLAKIVNKNCCIYKKILTYLFDEGKSFLMYLMPFYYPGCVYVCVLYHQWSAGRRIVTWTCTEVHYLTLRKYRELLIPCNVDTYILSSGFSILTHTFLLLLLFINNFEQIINRYMYVFTRQQSQFNIPIRFQYRNIWCNYRFLMTVVNAYVTGEEATIFLCICL